MAKWEIEGMAFRAKIDLALDSIIGLNDLVKMKIQDENSEARTASKSTTEQDEQNDNFKKQPPTKTAWASKRNC